MSSSTPVQLTGNPKMPPTSERAVPTALVCMPFAALERPSIQVGLLAAIAEEAGHPTSTFHLNLEFAHDLAELGGDAREQYDQISTRRYASADWYFSAAAFGDDAPPPSMLLQNLPDTVEQEGVTTEDLSAYLLKIRDHVVPAYLDRMMAEIDWAQFEVVGFTSTFQQTAAALALAHRIKQQHPELTTVFGGANFDGDMGREWVRTMECIDFVIQGEADKSFPRFLHAIASGRDPVGMAGVIAKRADEVVGIEAEVVDTIDANPTPTYHEYFERMDRRRLVDHLDVALPFESARGCWWGAKRHCTFCGLNGQTMDYRSKRPERVLEELTELALAHRSLRFESVDNILELDYLDSLLPALADRNRPFSLFYEVKADLTREQIELLVRSGIDHIQPGIESMHSRVLGLMRKGTRAIWNVNVLRWCRYYGISVAWNVLWGFPGEQAAHVCEQAELLPTLRHLQPPGSGGRIWLERFSPLFRDREAFPARMIEPQAFYEVTYPDTVDHDEIAYFFDYELEDTLPDEAYGPLLREIDTWHQLAEFDEPMVLLVEDRGEELVITDRRSDAPAVTHALAGLDAQIHRTIMETWRSPKQLAQSTGAPIDRVQSALDRLVHADLVFADGNLYLALALPTEAPAMRGRICEMANPWEQTATCSPS